MKFKFDEKELDYWLSKTFEATKEDFYRIINQEWKNSIEGNSLKIKHRDIEALFYHGEMEQKKKLLRDHKKPDFLEGSLNASVARIKDEFDELDAEYIKYAMGSSNVEKIMAEASDVANEAQILILKCKRKLGEI